jgi:hypothetical protein
VRGAEPYVGTFDADDIKETTDKGLKALREKMSGLELYEGWEPNRECWLLVKFGVFGLIEDRNQNHP